MYLHFIYPNLKIGWLFKNLIYLYSCFNKFLINIHMLIVKLPLVRFCLSIVERKKNFFFINIFFFFECSVYPHIHVYPLFRFWRVNITSPLYHESHPTRCGSESSLHLDFFCSCPIICLIDPNTISSRHPSRLNIIRLSHLLDF